MAKIKREPGATGSIRTILGPRNNSVYRRVYAGQYYIAAMPIKRGKPKSAITLEQNDGMKRLAQATREINTIDIVAARLIAEGSHYTWRDVLSRAMVGRLINIGQEDVLTPQQILDAISDTPGAILWRSETEWVVLLPGDIDQVITLGVDGITPEWRDSQGGGGGSGGLWSTILSATPTGVSTGLSTWVNQGTASTVDTSSGISIIAPSSSSANLRLLTAPAPSTPYSITALCSIGTTDTNFVAGGIGWYDGTNKSQWMGQVHNSSWQIHVENWSTPTAGSAGTVASASIEADMIWLQIEDDGASIYCRWSRDGSNFTQLYTVAKSTGYLGASGYSNIAMITDPLGAGTVMTIMSWKIT